MEFIFQISDYNASGLEAETAELLRQRLEAHSRQVVPGMWKVTDKLNAHAARGPGREKRRTRYRVYGVFLIALGIFALVPGLMEPRVPSLIWAGGFAVFAGILEFCLVRERKPLRPSAAERKEAAELLKFRRETDWKTFQAEVRFDEDGWTVTTAEGESRTTYDRLRGVFETERLWMLVCERDMALLLHKKDLARGDPTVFSQYIQQKITK